MFGALQCFVQRTASTRAGAWLFARTAHRLDLFLIRLSKNRYSLTGILSGLPVVTLVVTGTPATTIRQHTEDAEDAEELS